MSDEYKLPDEPPLPPEKEPDGELYKYESPYSGCGYTAMVALGVIIGLAVQFAIFGQLGAPAGVIAIFAVIICLYFPHTRPVGIGMLISLGVTLLLVGMCFAILASH